MNMLLEKLIKSIPNNYRNIKVKFRFDIGK